MVRLMAVLWLAVSASAAGAQESWPNRPITLMTGFPNGAGTDLYARKLAEPLGRALGQPVVVDHRTGAGGNIASDAVAKARPDGSLFLLGTAGTHAINAALYRNLPFDPIGDVTHVILLGDVPNVLVVNPERQPNWQSCRDVLIAARARPGALNYGSTGNGASTHLAGAQFATATGVSLTHVPYRGQPGAMQALLSGDIELFFNQTGPAIAPVQQGQLRALAVTTAAPIPALPGVPTMADACAMPGFRTGTWYGLFGPPGLPVAIRDRMNREVAAIIGAPEFAQWLVNSQGITPPADTSVEAFRAVHAADIARWAAVVRESGAQVD